MENDEICSHVFHERVLLNETRLIFIFYKAEGAEFVLNIIINFIIQTLLHWGSPTYYYSSACESSHVEQSKFFEIGRNEFQDIEAY